MIHSRQPTDLLPLSVIDRVRLAPTMVRMIWTEIQCKRGADVQVHDDADPPRPPAVACPRWLRLFRRARNLLAFLRRMTSWNASLLRRCCHELRTAAARGETEVVLYGEGFAAEMVCRCAPVTGVKVAAVCPWGLPTSHVPPTLWRWAESSLGNWSGAIVVAAPVNSRRHVDRLLRLGVSRERMIVLE